MSFHHIYYISIFIFIYLYSYISIYIAKEKLPKYLEGRMKWKDRRILAKFRCGNETKAREYNTRE